MALKNYIRHFQPQNKKAATVEINVVQFPTCNEINFAFDHVKMILQNNDLQSYLSDKQAATAKLIVDKNSKGFYFGIFV